MTTIKTMTQSFLAQHLEIKLVILFGSSVTGDGRHESNVDLVEDNPIRFRE